MDSTTKLDDVRDCSKHHLTHHEHLHVDEVLHVKVREQKVGPKETDAKSKSMPLPSFEGDGAAEVQVRPAMLREQAHS